MRRSVLSTVAILAATALSAGCGGSDVPKAVGGCTIEPGAQCPNADLSGADLEGADLSRADLSGANLTDTNLSEANLSEANLSDATIVDTDLSDADLTRANLTGATITGTNLEGATLCGTTRTDGTTDDSGCPASTDTTDTTETTDTTTAEAEVTSFEVGDLTCEAGATTGAVAVAWKTQNATAVDIEVDSESPVSGFGPMGSTSVTVPCDGEEHEIAITALNDLGEGESESEDVGPQ
jgi:hypothetical protein